MLLNPFNSNSFKFTDVADARPDTAHAQCHRSGSRHKPPRLRPAILIVSLFTRESRIIQNRNNELQRTVYSNQKENTIKKDYDEIMLITINQKSKRISCSDLHLIATLAMSIKLSILY